MPLREHGAEAEVELVDGPATPTPAASRKRTAPTRASASADAGNGTDDEDDDEVQLVEGPPPPANTSRRKTTKRARVAPLDAALQRAALPAMGFQDALCLAKWPRVGEWRDSKLLEFELDDVPAPSADATHGAFCDASFPADVRSISGSTRDPSMPQPQPPRCECGRPAEQKVVHKGNRNEGRRFWSCKTRACGLFKWALRSEWVASDRDRALVWRRPPRFPVYPRVVGAPGFRADDVRQGALGDCWFLSALSVLATRGDLVARLFPSSEPRPAGGPYSVRLFIDGAWRLVQVDDRLPCVAKAEHKSRKLKLNQNQDFTLAFCKAARNQLWVPLLEKAYAKAHGSYRAIHGGWVAEALFDLTGRPTETLRIGALGEEELFHLLCSYHSAGFPMGASCLNPGQFSGLVAPHAYSVLDLRTTRTAAERQATLTDMLGRSSGAPSGGGPPQARARRFIRLRNPHGKGEWRGEFSRKAPQWTPRLRAELGHSDEDNGTFWMPFDLFLAHFNGGSVDVCKAPLPGSEWHFDAVNGALRPGEWFSRDVVELRTRKPTWLHVTLCQPTKRGRADGRHVYSDLLVLIAKLGADGASLSSVARVSRGGATRAHHFDLLLEADSAYALLVLSPSRLQQPQDEQAPLALRLLCAKPVQRRTRQVGDAPFFALALLHAGPQGMAAATAPANGGLGASTSG